MPLALATAPATAIFTTTEVKAHLRVDGSDEDTLISNLIEAFRTYVDGKGGILNRALVTQTWDLWLDAFPASSLIPLLMPLAPVQSISFVKYYDGNNELQTWDSANYYLDTVSEPGRLFPVYNGVWPSALDRPNAVNVRFVAGYGATAASIPQAIRQAGLLTIGHWFANRESINIGNITSELPQSADMLLAPYRVRLEQEWG